MNEREKFILKCRQEVLDSQLKTLKKVDETICEISDKLMELHLLHKLDLVDEGGEGDNVFTDLSECIFNVRTLWEAIEGLSFKTKWEECELGVYKNETEVCKIIFNEDELPKIIRIIFKNGQQAQWATSLSNLKFLHEIKEENS